MDKYRIVKYFGIMLILLSVLLSLVSVVARGGAHSQEADTPEDLAGKLRQLDFAEYLMKWCQILVLAGIGLIILTKKDFINVV